MLERSFGKISKKLLIAKLHKFSHNLQSSLCIIHSHIKCCHNHHSGLGNQRNCHYVIALLFANGYSYLEVSNEVAV